MLWKVCYYEYIQHVFIVWVNVKSFFCMPTFDGIWAKLQDIGWHNFFHITLQFDGHSFIFHLLIQ